jgi:NAD(P)-dependent dehydrogenase (short-subunit alcohol dehydrogenase family)
MTKTVIITGATRGIGRATALRLLEQGHNLVLNYHANEANAAATLAACRGFGERALSVKADVSRAGEVERLIGAALDRFGRLDVLVNNASINRDRPLLELSEEDWDRVVDTNMKSVFLTSRAAGRVMLDQAGGGHIINLGATTGITGRAGGLNYCASKAGVLVMTKCLAIELAPKVRVNCVLPGTIRTPEVDERYDLAANEPAMAEQIPMGRIGEPEEVAAAIAFLISAEAGYINGQKLIVNGGSFLY